MSHVANQKLECHQQHNLHAVWLPVCWTFASVFQQDGNQIVPTVSQNSNGNFVLMSDEHNRF